MLCTCIMYAWCAHGEATVRATCLMICACCVHCVSMVCACCVHALSFCPWCVYDVCVVRLWCVKGVCVWYVHSSWMYL